jgi:hypothetical protein
MSNVHYTIYGGLRQFAPIGAHTSALTTLAYVS